MKSKPLKMDSKNVLCMSVRILQFWLIVGEKALLDSQIRTSFVELTLLKLKLKGSEYWSLGSWDLYQRFLIALIYQQKGEVFDVRPRMTALAGLKYLLYWVFILLFLR